MDQILVNSETERGLYGHVESLEGNTSVCKATVQQTDGFEKNKVKEVVNICSSVINYTENLSAFCYQWPLMLLSRHMQP